MLFEMMGNNGLAEGYEYGPGRLQCNITPPDRYLNRMRARNYHARLELYSLVVESNCLA